MELSLFVNEHTDVLPAGTVLVAVNSNGTNMIFRTGEDNVQDRKESGLLNVAEAFFLVQHPNGIMLVPVIQFAGRAGTTAHLESPLFIPDYLAIYHPEKSLVDHFIQSVTGIVPAASSSIIQPN